MQASKVGDGHPIEESESCADSKHMSAPDIERIKPPFLPWIPAYLAGTVCTGLLTYVFHTHIASKIPLDSYPDLSAVISRFIFCALFGSMVFYLIRLVLACLAMAMKRSDPKREFMQITLIKHGMFMSFVATLFVLSFVVDAYNKRINATTLLNVSSDALPLLKEIVGISVEDNELKQTLISEEKANGDQKSPKTLTMFITDDLAKILLASSAFLAVLLAKEILMNGLKYKMLFKNYEIRISKNDEDIKILEQLNRATGKQMIKDAEEWADEIFKLIYPESNAVDLQTLEYFFGTDDAKTIFNRFSIYPHGKLTRESFSLVYQGIINEEKRISRGIIQKASIIKKLNLVLSAILIPVGMLAAMTILENTNSLARSLPVQFSTVISLNFIFAPIIADMFKSLVFVFLVEVFDIGDKVFIEGVLHEVHNMGLLYTSFVVDKKITVIPNSKFMDKTIVNLREAKTSQKTFEFTFMNSPDLKEKIIKLKDEIKKEVESDSNAYTGKFNICEYALKKSLTIGMKINVVFRVQNQNIKALRAREDAFVIALYGIVGSIGLLLE